MVATAVQPRSRNVLADFVPGAIARDAILIGLAAILTGISAQFSFHIPGTPVPVTGQTFAVLLSGAALGWRRGALGMLLYLAAGLAGVPWFAQHSSGYVAASFGYIIGFVFAAAVVGTLAARGGDRTVARTLATMVLGSVIIYLIGTSWLAIDLGVGPRTAFSLGVQPFLWGDTAKILLAAGVLPAAWWAVEKTNSESSSS